MTGELRTTEVDGVPVYWVPGEGRLRAGLWFRAGLADESLPTHGWLHLLEHLALHDRGSIRVPVNGYVSMLHTSFDVEGEPDDVTAFLQQVCQWVSAPDFGDLEHERRVLRAEGATRGAGAVATHLLWRYGAQGPGLAGYDEFGLHSADAAHLQSLARQVFTRGNAVLALTGPPPAGLRLPLNAGDRWPIRPAVPCDQPLPGGFAGRPGAVAVSGVLPRSTAAAALTRALQRGLEGGFRHGAGVGYSGWSSYELVDADHAMVTAGIDILPEALPNVVRETTAVLRRLRDRGIDPADLRDDLEQELRRLKTEPTENWLPFLAARDALYGRPPTDRDQLAAEVEAVTVADVRQAARAMWNSLLLSVEPAGTGDPQLSWHTGPPPSRSVPTGQQHKPVGSPVAKGTLVVGRSGAHVETAAGATSASYDELAAVIAYPDGGRLLIRRDGYQLPIEPTLWNRGQEAVATVDGAASAALRVPMPAREPDEIPRPSVTWRQHAKYWLNNPVPWVAFVLILLIVVTLTTTIPLSELASPGAVGVLVVGAVAYLRERRSR